MADGGDETTQKLQQSNSDLREVITYMRTERERIDRKVKVLKQQVRSERAAKRRE